MRIYETIKYTYKDFRIKRNNTGITLNKTELNYWIQKPSVVLYTNNEILEIEVREKIPFTIATRKRKYLGINLTKEVKDLYSENYTTIKKELRKTQVNGSICCVHGLEELTSSKCLYYPKQFIDSMQSLLKYQWHISQI